MENFRGCNLFRMGDPCRRGRKLNCLPGIFFVIRANHHVGRMGKLIDEAPRMAYERNVHRIVINDFCLAMFMSVYVGAHWSLFVAVEIGFDASALNSKCQRNITPFLSVTV